MDMEYFLIPAPLAERLGVKGFRFGNDREGYVVNTSDIEIVGKEQVIIHGGRLLTAEEAKGWVRKFRSNK